jgi:cyclophilin family peptidyl-prolyl cis-trans isomerase
LREYVVRAAEVLADTSLLLRKADDVNANVQASAVDALRRLSAHAHDTLYMRLLESGAPQVVRSAALALAGSPLAESRDAAGVTYARWLNYGNASFRDVRHALLRAAGRDTSTDAWVESTLLLPPAAVPLALGERVLVRVTMAEESGGGSFTVRLRGDVAPIMAARILELVQRGYYDGLTWHRVEHDFVLQGGSPGANEYVGWRHFLRDELGTVPHARGTVGMSTRGHDTGDAQWFINLRDNLRLGRDYTVFGEVVDGIEVVDGVLEGDRIASMRVVQ